LPDGSISYQKIPIWVNFGGPWNGKRWYILWPFGIVYCHWVWIMAVWYSFCPFGTFWYVCTEKNLATLNGAWDWNWSLAGMATEWYATDRTRSENGWTLEQGDQIGRTSAQRVIIYFGQFFRKSEKKAKFLCYFFQNYRLCSNLDKNWFGRHFGPLKKLIWSSCCGTTFEWCIYVE
jgi:hypothetical protein